MLARISAWRFPFGVAWARRRAWVATPQYNGKEYANAIAEVLSQASTAGIPLSDIYVGAIGKKWVSGMYEAQPKLETEIQGWYLHPYGPPSGTHEEIARASSLFPMYRLK